MRCHDCDGFGNKDKYCLRIMKQPQKNVSYNIDKKIWGEKESSLGQCKKGCVHIKKWIKKVP